VIPGKEVDVDQFTVKMVLIGGVPCSSSLEEMMIFQMSGESYFYFDLIKEDSIAILRFWGDGESTLYGTEKGTYRYAPTCLHDGIILETKEELMARARAEGFPV
jgi:hypothetical protein